MHDGTISGIVILLIIVGLALALYLAVGLLGWLG
jgi:hypothetical protein